MASPKSFKHANDLRRKHVDVSTIYVVLLVYPRIFSCFR